MLVECLLFVLVAALLWCHACVFFYELAKCRVALEAEVVGNVLHGVVSVFDLYLQPLHRMVYYHFEGWPAGVEVCYSCKVLWGDEQFVGEIAYGSVVPVFAAEQGKEFLVNLLHSVVGACLVGCFLAAGRYVQVVYDIKQQRGEQVVNKLVVVEVV